MYSWVHINGLVQGYVVTPLLTHWSCCSLTLITAVHRYVFVLHLLSCIGFTLSQHCPMSPASFHLMYNQFSSIYAYSDICFYSWCTNHLCELYVLSLEKSVILLPFCVIITRRFEDCRMLDIGCNFAAWSTGKLYCCMVTMVTVLLYRGLKHLLKCIWYCCMVEMLLVEMYVLVHGWYGSGHEAVAVLLPGFAINW